MSTTPDEGPAEHTLGAGHPCGGLLRPDSEPPVLPIVVDGELIAEAILAFDQWGAPKLSLRSVFQRDADGFLQTPDCQVVMVASRVVEPG